VFLLPGAYLPPIEFRLTGSGPRFSLQVHSPILLLQDIDQRRECFAVAASRICTSKGIRMQTGTVKWFNSQKGFGFIQPETGGPDVFVHISAVERAGFSGLNEGQKISYEVVADRRTGKSSADRLQAAA
jgi:CspA family cold shock protein